MKFKIFLISSFLFITVQSNSQSYIKANALSALILIPNIGYETALSNHLSFQVDVNASFWKSINGHPYQFVTVIPEIRYHFKETFSGFYFGAHIGGAAYNLHKWNYKALNYRQEGYSYLLGGTIGYQRKISEKFMLEAFLGGGSQQGFYKGYIGDTGVRYETAKKFNKSGEWLPYRGGLMVCYKLN